MTEFESALVIMGSVSGVVLLAVVISLVANWFRDRLKNTEKSKWYKITSGKF